VLAPDVSGRFRYRERLTTFQLLERLVVQLVGGIVQHRGVVMRVAVQVVMVHRALQMVAVQAGHRGGRRDRVLMMLHGEAARRPDHEILKAQIRAATTAAASAAAATAASTAAAAPGEFEAPPGPAAPLHAVEG